MGLVVFNLHQNHSHRYKWDTQTSILSLTLYMCRNAPINPSNRRGKHSIFFPSWKESGWCCTDTSIVVKVVQFNGEFCTMAPLTWLRLIGDPGKAIEWLNHNNGCYPSVTQPNCMFVWNNPLRATKGKPRVALIPECIPGDGNASPLCAKTETCRGQGRLYTPDLLHRLVPHSRLQHCISCDVRRCNGLACRAALSGLSMYMRCVYMTSYDHTLALRWRIATLLQCNEIETAISAF